MIVFTGKARDLTYKKLLELWLEQTREIEPLEALDFCSN